jgi:uncharacterized membrane protein HdeD (DUF308 family)
VSPGERPGRDRRRADVVAQTGQTLLVLGAVVLVVGLLISSEPSTVWVGVALLAVGAVVFVVGLRGRRRDPGA